MIYEKVFFCILVKFVDSPAILLNQVNFEVTLMKYKVFLGSLQVLVKRVLNYNIFVHVYYDLHSQFTYWNVKLYLLFNVC